MRHGILVTATALLALSPFASQAQDGSAQRLVGVPDMQVPVPSAALDSLAFEGVPWNTPRWAMDPLMAARRFKPDARLPGVYHGRRFEQPVEVRCEYDLLDQLIAVTVRFDPKALGDAVALYTRIAAEKHSSWGAPAAQIDLGRSGERVGWGVYAHLLPAGPPTAATLWVAAREDAAAVQLDGQHRVWLRYESWRYTKARAEREARFGPGD